MQKKKPDKMLGVLAAATSLFSEKSFHDVKLETVAERAGVGKGTIYTYFKSKDELFVQCLVHDVPASEERMQSIIDADLSFYDALKQLVELKNEKVKQKGPLVEQLRALGPQLKISETEYKRLTEMFKRSMARLAKFFQRAIDTGLLGNHLTAGQMAVIFDKIFELNMTFTFFKEPVLEPEMLCDGVLRFFGATPEIAGK